MHKAEGVCDVCLSPSQTYLSLCLYAFLLCSVFCHRFYFMCFLSPVDHLTSAAPFPPVDLYSIYFYLCTKHICIYVIYIFCSCLLSVSSAATCGGLLLRLRLSHPLAVRSNCCLLLLLVLLLWQQQVQQQQQQHRVLIYCLPPVFPYSPACAC